MHKQCCCCCCCYCYWMTRCWPISCRTIELSYTKTIKAFCALRHFSVLILKVQLFEIWIDKCIAIFIIQLFQSSLLVRHTELYHLENFRCLKTFLLLAKNCQYFFLKSYKMWKTNLWIKTVLIQNRTVTCRFSYKTIIVYKYSL